MRKFRVSLSVGHLAAALALLGTTTVVAADRPVVPALSEVAGHAALDRIAPWHSRFGRARPVVAIIGNNSGTELVDFVVPYGVLMASGAADVVTVSAHPGPLAMRPALRLQAQATTHEFNARYPDGADYVIASDRRFDWIIVDGFDGHGRPGTLDTLPFYCNCVAT